MLFGFQWLKDLFVQTDGKTRDKLGAYPERIHVRALPERRYLKTARIMTLATLISLLMNIAICFLIMHLSPRMTTDIGQGSRNQLFQADKFFKEVSTLPNSKATLHPKRLIVDAEMARYARELFTVLPNKDEMEHIWAPDNFLMLANSISQHPSFWAKKREAFELLEKGVNTEVWVHTIHYSKMTGLYEIIFDVFYLNNAEGLKRVCHCTFQNEACKTCLKADAFDVKRYKMAIRPGWQTARKIANPYGFSLENWVLFRLPIYTPDNPETQAEAQWADVQLAR